MEKLKVSQSDHSTHINELTKDIVLNILSHLPLGDAVRTSILSRKWRYTWIEIPRLIFNDNFCGKQISGTKSKLLMAIYQVLLLHQGPLREFTLHLSNLDGSWSQIDNFLLAVVKRGVKDLTIWMNDGDSYTLPSLIFDYRQQFEHLKLVSCVYKPPSGFNGFSNLETLELEEVNISGNGLSSLISNCPLLRRLDFKSCISSDRIDIVALNLDYLNIDCRCMPICFKNTPKLTTVKIFSREVRKDALIGIVASSDFMLSGRLPIIEQLWLDDFYLMHATASKAPRLFVDDLCRLKRLDFSYFCFQNHDDLSSALSLIRNSQNLMTLVIKAHITKDGIDNVVIDDFSDITLSHLKKVELRGASGLKCEMQFIKFVLAKSPILGIFFIKLGDELVGDKKMNFFKELSMLRRASPLVEISYEE